MNTIEFIRMSLDFSQGWAKSILEDMKDAPLTQPTSDGGNHPLWLLGHITHSESTLLDQFILGKPNRFEAWGELFGMGSTPVPEADRYPSMDELFAQFDAVRADALAHLATLSEADLDKPSHAPEAFGPVFATVGSCYSAMITHVPFHAGQAADARRVAGRKPLMG